MSETSEPSRPTVLYRFSAGPYIYLEQYRVAAYTSKGYWIHLLRGFAIRDDSPRKWVSATARKRFAYPTIEEARNSFLERAKRRVVHCERHLHQALAVLRYFEATPEAGPVPGYYPPSMWHDFDH